jgi:tetratricopeptide (TPR) repeat protein
MYFLVFFFVAISAERPLAEGFEFTHKSELDKILEQIFGGFDYTTAVVDDCKAPYDKISAAISNGAFGDSKPYLANAYIHQGMLGACLMQNLSNEEAMEHFGPVLDSYEKALQITPDWDVPYAMLGNIYRARGNYTQSIEDFRQAEKFMVKALQINSQNIDYEQMLEEIRSNFTANQSEDIQNATNSKGFIPIPFE